jgi:hypothetical protein
VSLAATPQPVDAAWDKLYARADARLRERMAEYECPEPEWVPGQDIVVVYRFPNEYKGLVYLPEAYADGHDAQYSIGLLLMAGPEAQDILESHGVLPGDVVKFARWAGEEEAANRVQEAKGKARQAGASEAEATHAAIEVRDAEMAKKKLLEFQVPFIRGSVDLKERLYGDKPTMERVRIVTAKGEPMHVIRPVAENL